MCALRLLDGRDSSSMGGTLRKSRSFNRYRNSLMLIPEQIVLTFSVGIAFVRVYGEVEFWFAIIKILFIIFLIIFGLVVSLGGN